VRVCVIRYNTEVASGKAKTVGFCSVPILCYSGLLVELNLISTFSVALLGTYLQQWSFISLALF